MTTLATLEVYRLHFHKERFMCEQAYLLHNIIYDKYVMIQTKV